MPAGNSFRSLAPADFTFHGFDDLMPALVETLRGVGIRSGEPAVETVEGAVFVPSTKIQALRRSPGRFAHQGGLVTGDGQSIDLAQSRRRGTRWGTRVLGGFDQPVPIAPERELDEEVIYLGWYFSHFGHFLSESLARAWFLEQADPSLRVVFHRLGRTVPSGTTKRMLEAFGIPMERILLFDEPTRLRRVIIPEQLYELSVSAHERLTRPFHHVARAIVGAGRVADQPVYLSRRLLPGHLRQIVGEFELEEVLRENGFLIVSPETMSFEDQIQLVNTHRHIFTSAGSAAYNILFNLHQPTVHFLTSGIPREDYFLAPTVAGAAAAYCNCFGRGGRPEINASPLLIDIPTFVDYLANHGFLKTRFRASLTAQGPRAAAAFDEAWLYAMVRDVPRGEAPAADLEQEAHRAARHSWPLSWMLAQVYAFADTSRVDALARQFAELAAGEADIGRIARFHDDIEAMAPRILRKCTKETVDLVAGVLRDRFIIDNPRGKRREGKGEPGSGDGDDTIDGNQDEVADASAPATVSGRP